MGLFKGLQIALDLGYDLKFTKKIEVKKKILENGGIISYIITRKCHLLITNDPEKCTSSLKSRMAIKYGLPVLKLDYIWDSLQASSLLPYDSYVVGGKSKILDFRNGKISASMQKEKLKKFSSQTFFNPRAVKVWTAADSHQPWQYEENHEVAKYAVFKGHNYVLKCQTMTIIELHAPPARLHMMNSSEMVVDKGHKETHFNYRVVFQTGNTKDLEVGKPCHTETRYVVTAEQALAVFAMLHEDTERKTDMIKWTGPVRALGSIKFQKLMAGMVDVHSGCSEPVKELVEHVWGEAMAEVTFLLGDISAIKIEQVEKAEAILLKARDAIKLSSSENIIQDLINKFYSTLPHRHEASVVDINERKRWLAKKQDMCQLIRDMISVSEMTDYETRACIEAKYAALRCRITHLTGSQKDEIEDLVLSTLEGPSQDLRILNVYEVWRQAEDLDFSHDLDGKQLLFHSSMVENFVGILSRGLLLPKVVVDDFGGKRSDAGNLGSGIYFASSASKSVKYSSPSNIKGSRLLLINEVALGRSKDYTCHDSTLVAPPDGYNSTHGVSRKSEKSSEFEYDEFVVYAVNQQRVRYLVEFTVRGDVIKPVEIIHMSDNSMQCDAVETATINDVVGLSDPLSKIKAGLTSKGDLEVKLCGVHIRAKLIDLAAQVVVLQEYCNNSQQAIEAKYVFPLEDTATVCGFEAFINGKHIVGEVKEKEIAHKEYKKAISEGHGAYLMDQDVEIPDVFTVSVGNLPAGANVLIKITYVAELQMEGEHISFSLPAAVAPWTENAALKQSTQDELKSHKMTLSKTTVQVAVEMPCEIRKLHCPTHKIRVKQTASKAYVEMMKHQIFGAGFQLLISLAEIHVPRMWVERHPVNTNYRACMLTCYPEFESEEVTNGEVIIILDASTSMKGSAMIEAKKVALLILQNVPSGWHFNVVRFGSEYEELFAAPKIKKEDTIQLAISFVQNSVANKGNTDVMKPLHSLFLLPRSEGQRNVFLISDGHINSDEHVLHHANQNSVHTRVFSFGVSATCNSYFLKALSRVSGGAFEFFNIKTKSKWEPKVKSQISKACQPGLTSVAVEWQQYDDNVPLPVQAPRQITALFNGSRQVVYGFVSNCTMATLKAKVEGQEVSTVVSTSDLSITEGLLVHRLTARAVIRDWEDGVLASDRIQHEMAKMDLKSYIIDLSKKYSIVTKFTSFIAVEKREENEKDLPKSGPSVEELVDKENVDILSYMGWTTLPEDDNITVMTMINKLSQAVRQQELSNKVLYEMEAIEDKYRELREQAGPLNDDVLNVALVLMDVYCQIGEIDKAVNTAEIAYKEAVRQAFRMVEDPDYPKLADMLLDLRNRALSIKKNIDVVLSDPIPLPKNADGKVIIQFLTGSQLTISCRDTLTFGHLNELIRTREGIPINDLRLIYNGRKFDDSTLLGDVKVGHGDSIYAIKMLRGGGGVNLCESDEGSSGIVASKEVEEEKDDDMGYSLDGDNSIEESVVGSSGTVASKEVEEEEEDDDMGFGLFDGDDAVGVSREKETSASLKIDEPLPAETVHVLDTSGKTYDQSATRFLKAVELPQPMYSPTSPSYQSISMSQAPPPPPTVSLDVDSLQATRAADLPQPVYSPKSPAHHHQAMYMRTLPAYQSISMSQAPPPPPPPPPPVTFSLDQSVEKEKAERLQHLYKATDQLAPIFGSLQALEVGILPPPRKCRKPCINLGSTPPPLPPRQNLLGHSVGMSGQLQHSTALFSASPSQALSQSQTLLKRHATSMRAGSAASFDQQSVSETPHVSFGMPPSTSSPTPSLSSSECHKVRDKELSADFAKASVALYNKVVDTESPTNLSEAPKTSSGSISSHAQLPLLTKKMHMVQHRPMKMAKISVFPTELGHTQSSEGQTGESEDLKCQSSLLPVLDIERFCKMNLFKRRYMSGKARTSDAIPQSHEPPARMQTTPLQASSGISCIRTNKDALQLKDLVKLIKYQTEVGSWELKSNLDDLLGINSNQCLNILMSSGLGSLGKSTAEDIKQLVATLLVLFSIMELLIPEYFPIGGSSARELPASGICFEKIAFDTLVLSDHSHIFLRVVTAIRKAFKFCVKMEQQHPVVYSTLELGTSWLNVTTTFMQSHVE